MIWFLRLFQAFVDLESQVKELDSARAECARLVNLNEVLQDRLDSAMQDRKQLWATVQQALEGERGAYQAGLNMLWQQRGFGAPYPEAPQIPPQAIPTMPADPIVPRREIPSERVDRATRQFVEEMAHRLMPKA